MGVEGGAGKCAPRKAAGFPPGGSRLPPPPRAAARWDKAAVWAAPPAAEPDKRPFFGGAGRTSRLFARPGKGGPTATARSPRGSCGKGG